VTEGQTLSSKKWPRLPSPSRHRHFHFFFFFLWFPPFLSFFSFFSFPLLPLSDLLSEGSLSLSQKKKKNLISCMREADSDCDDDPQDNGARIGLCKGAPGDVTRAPSQKRPCRHHVPRPVLVLHLGQDRGHKAVAVAAEKIVLCDE
jgi:hypothetical protein